MIGRVSERREVIHPISINGMGEEVRIGLNRSTINVNGVENRLDIDCNRGRIVISGINNRIRIGQRGEGGSVQDSGMGNRIEYMDSPPRRTDRGQGQSSGRTQGRHIPSRPSRPQRDMGGGRRTRESMPIRSRPSGQGEWTIRIGRGGEGIDISSAGRLVDRDVQIMVRQMGERIRAHIHSGMDPQSYSDSLDSEDIDSMDYDSEDMDSIDENSGEEEIDDDEEIDDVDIIAVKRNRQKIQEVCVICTEQFCKSNREAAFLHCNHWFHFECIHKWVNMKNKCPQCMMQVKEVFVNCG